MKYLLLLLVLAVVYAIWRSQNRPIPPPARKNPPLAPPQDMVACRHCGLHLPRSEALTSGQRHYCCAEHQRNDA